MIKIQNLDIVKDLINKIKIQKKQYLTNFYFDYNKINSFIQKEQLFYLYDNDNSVIFFKSNIGFFNLYYCTTNVFSLQIMLKNLIIKKSLKVVIEVVDNSGKRNEFDSIFNYAGLDFYSSLIRMSRINFEGAEDVYSPKIVFASENNVNELEFLIYSNFDKYSEQLPTFEEIHSYIINKNVLVYFENKTIVGFVIFEITGLTSHLKYWFVHPDYRNFGIGSLLLRKYFFLSKNSKRILFWVIENNLNAISRYEHFGFTKENLRDYIYLNFKKNGC